MPDYVETSAVLSWLLQEDAAQQVAAALGSSNLLVCSELTFVECARALVRLHGSLAVAPLAHLNRQIQALRASSHVVTMTPAVLARVGQPFPVEPVRTLDAIHLGTALELTTDLPRLSMLSLDYRVRDNWAALGLPLTI